MAGPATPGQEGPSYAPPQLPEGWIPQWDAVSKKYYFVQLSTGASQWETPTHAAPTGPTPQATPQGVEHPYGTPGQGYGSEMQAGDGTRGVGGPDGDRSLGGDLGKLAMNQFLGGGKPSKNSSSGGSNPLLGLAGSFLGGGSKPHGGSSGGNSAATGIAGALMGSLIGGGKKPEQHGQNQNYSGGQQQSQGGLMGSLGGMFGGGHQQSNQGSSYGYSSSGGGHNGGYSGSAPPTSYQPGAATQGSYNQPQQHQQPGQQQHYGQGQPQPHYGAQQSYGGSPAGTPAYGGNSQPQYGAPSPAGQPPFGGIQHQDTYGGHQQASAPSYGSGGTYGQPQHGQPQHGQPPYGQHPPPPNQQGSYGPPGGYPGQQQGQQGQQGQQRW